MEGILLAVGQQKLVDLFSKSSQLKNYNVLGNIRNKDELIEGIKKYQPDILLVAEGLPSQSGIDTNNLLLSIKQMFPRLRIVFLSGKIDKTDTYNINRLGRLVDSGIYDIYHDSSMSSTILAGLLDNKKTYADVSYMLHFKNLQGDTNFDYMEDAPSGKVGMGYGNISVFSSIKPGTGKSFISTNVAAGIAKYGRPLANGKRPVVAIIEGDLQTLSVGTLLQLEDRERNLNKALKKVGEVINENGEIFGTSEQIESVKRFVRGCFLKCYQVDNLYALVGTQLSLNELNHINPYQYYYLVELMVDQFDVIIVDMNSSLEHKTTGSLLDLARNCYYILDLDFNNVSNNIRYRNELANLGVLDKVNYILNKDIPKDMENNFAEKLEYNADNLNASGFSLVAKVPMVDTTVVYNRVKQGIPLVLDKTEMTLAARQELLIVSDQIWSCDVMYDLKQEMDSYANPKNKKTKHKWFWKS
ncbi:MAG: hypothetical protein RSC93_11040 [Erysipelotrichaceae bacterium]